jgi:DMSO/TMAO reductase YedYZ molybdopterin-dependent catalytic subunit
MTNSDERIQLADPAQGWQEALDAGLVGHSEQPLNCETPPPLLGADITPVGRFFRRNHFPIPDLDAAAWRLEVGGLVRRRLRLGLDQLKQLGPESKVAVLECAGNGRALFSPPADGEPWALGAVGNARWTGARLADVLDLAGIRPSASEIVFRGADRGTVDGSPGPVAFERSLGVGQVRESGALLAYAMNGEPLPARHGFPVRLVVPGQYAVASVKWLTEITVTDRPFDGFFQAAHYVFEWQRGGTAVREPVGQSRVRALITSPGTGDELACGSFAVCGVAWSGAATVTRVEVSLDGREWRAADMDGASGPHGWQRWHLLARTGAAGEITIRARATDRAGHTQPEQPEQPEWNRMGYGGNFIHQVHLRLRLAR